MTSLPLIQGRAQKGIKVRIRLEKDPLPKVPKILIFHLRDCLGRQWNITFFFPFPQIFLSYGPHIGKKVCSYISKGGYTYVWKLTDVTKMDFMMETVYRMYQGGSLMSLEAYDHGELMDPYNPLKDKDHWKAEYNHITYDKNQLL